MKKLLLINSVLGYGSTGHIVLDIAKEYELDGYQVKIAYGRNSNVSKENEVDLKKYGVRIGNDMDVCYHVLYTRFTDKHGLASKAATKRFLKWANNYNPDVLWLHNIHGYYINYELLFEWIKSRPQMQVKWTLHDCWAFTGHCSHFSYVKCNKWQQGCCACPQLEQYPRSVSDNSTDNYNRKKVAFTGLPNLTIITPSNWLKERVQRSFLSEYSVSVKYNVINTDIFKPTPNTFKQDYHIYDKKMILGVSSVWNERKGLKDFIDLSNRLDPQMYQVVLVGLNKSQIEELSITAPKILGLSRISDMKELAKIYSAADIFVNPSYEETFGLTVSEAQSCGAYSIVYQDTACAEILRGDNGKSVSPNVLDVERAIYKKDNHVDI